MSTLSCVFETVIAVAHPDIVRYFKSIPEAGPKIVFGAVIIFAGAFIANMVSGAMKSAGGGATDTAADIMKWVIVVFTTILGISRMGLDPTGGTFVLDVAKYGVMGAAAAGAIAFGWGGKDWAAKQLERMRSSQ